MISTYIHTGVLTPKDCCVNLYLQAVPLADALKLDVLRDRLAVYGSGESTVWISARVLARQVVECNPTFHPVRESRSAKGGPMIGSGEPSRRIHTVRLFSLEATSPVLCCTSPGLSLPMHAPTRDRRSR